MALVKFPGEEKRYKRNREKKGEQQQKKSHQPVKALAANKFDEFEHRNFNRSRRFLTFRIFYFLGAHTIPDCRYSATSKRSKVQLSVVQNGRRVHCILTVGC